MKFAISLVLLLFTLTLLGALPAQAQLIYPSSQLLQVRKAKLIVVGEVVYRGKISKSFSTHPALTWQTIVIKLIEVMKGEEKGKYLRVAFFTEKELITFSKGDKLILVLDDNSETGCGENSEPIVIKKENGKTIRNENSNSPIFKEYELSSCFYAYPVSAYEATAEELETMRIFLRAIKSNS